MSDEMSPPTATDDGPDLRLPLSLIEQGTWRRYYSVVVPSGTTDTILYALLLTGPLDVESLRTAVDQLVGRHENLRTAFVQDPGDVLCRNIAPPPRGVLELVAPAISGDRDGEIGRRLRAELETPCDPVAGRVFRARLWPIEPGAHLLTLAWHHIVTDAWSTNVLVNDLSRLYAAARRGRPSDLRPLAMQPADFALWESAWLDGEAAAQCRTYWREQLGAVVRSAAGAGASAALTRAGRATTRAFEVSSERGQAIKTAAAARGMTSFMIVVAAFAVAIEPLALDSGCTIGVPIALRGWPESQEVVGMLGNVLPIHVTPRETETHDALLAQVALRLRDAYRHKELSYEGIRQALAEDGGPVPDSLHTFMCNLAPAGTPPVFDELEATRVPSPYEPALNSLVGLHVQERGSAFAGGYLYRTDLVSAAEMDRVDARFHNALDAIVEEPHRPIGTSSAVRA